jgi:cytochrome c
MEDPMRSRLRRNAGRALVQAAAVLVAWACLGADDARAAGDAAKGQRAFARQCAICHTVEEGGPNRFGPNLFGILHRKAGTVAGFDYSRAFKAAATWDWNADLVAGWIGAPGVMVPGTAMGVFQGVAQSDRDDIVAYLATRQ